MIALRASLLAAALVAALPCAPLMAQTAETATQAAPVDHARHWVKMHGEASRAIESDAGQAGLDAAEKVVAYAEAHFGAESGRALTSYQLKGQALHEMGRYLEAEKIWTPLLPKFEKLEGADDHGTLVLRANLANLYSLLGRYPEAAALGERGVEALKARYGDENTQTLSARNNLANTYAEMGEYEKARVQHQQIFETRERVLGVDHRNTLTSLHNLATIHDDLGDTRKAEELMRRAYEARVRTLGAESRDALSSTYYLGTLLRQRGDEPGAQALYRTAHTGYLRLLGPDHPQTLATLSTLGGVLEDEARYAESGPIFIKVLGIRERVLGPDHPETLNGALRLARHYAATERHDLAAPLYQRVADTRRRVFGAEHPNTLNALTDLAWFRFDRGERAVATQMLETLHRDRLRLFGAQHPDTLNAVHSLGNLYWSLDRFDDGERELRRAAAEFERVSGADNPSTLGVLADLAGLLTERSRYTEAGAILRPLRATYAARYGAEHPETLAIDVELAVNAFYQGKLGEAEKGYRDVLARTERLFGADHPRTLTAYNNLGVLFDEQGRFTEAEPLLQRAYDGHKKVYGEADRETIAQLITLGDLYRNQRRYDVAETALRQSYEAAAAKLGPESPVTLRAANQLGHTFREAARPADAESWYRRALAGRVKVLGPEHRSTLFTTNKLAVVLRDQGKFDEAERLFGQVLAAQLRTLRPGHIDFADSYSDFGGLLAARGNDPGKAIFFYKQAINVLQSTREEMRGAGDKEGGKTQASFVALWEPTYSRLQALLIAQGRFGEAEQVGRMLKETEYVSMVRGDNRPAREGLSLTTRESEWGAQLAGWADRPNRLAATIDGLKAKQAAGGTLTALEQRQLGELQTSYDAAYAAYQATINGWLGEVRKLDDEQLQEEARELEVRFSDRRRAEIAAIGPDVALLQIVAFEKSVEFFLITPKAMKHVSAPIPRETLFQAIYDARDLLKQGVTRRETRDPGHQQKVRAQFATLYDMLLRPVAGELADARTKTLMLNLQGKIRYAPFAALHDGKQWLVENYRLAIYTPAANTNYATPANMAGGSGLGLSQEFPGFDPLPAVPGELEAILTGSDRAGALKGDIALDGAFTRAALESALAKKEPVLHIASHFVMEPGAESNSFLLLGDGSKLTMAEIGQSSRLSFNGVELVTLSACETALGGEGTGMEIDGLGALAQNKGAGSVVATLWMVVDESTATLMTDFYGGIASGKASKAEALRQAQLKLLRTPKTADPYFWAPFVLMGNWK